MGSDQRQVSLLFTANQKYAQGQGNCLYTAQDIFLAQVAMNDYF